MSTMSPKSHSLSAIRAGERWRGADGALYVVLWVGMMGVVGYQRDGARGPESVTDAVRFVSGFVREPAPPPPWPAARAAEAG